MLCLFGCRWLCVVVVVCSGESGGWRKRINGTFTEHLPRIILLSYFRPSIMVNQQDQRQHLDLLFLFDSVVSLAFGVIALLSPHGLLQKIGGEYAHIVT